MSARTSAKGNSAQNDPTNEAGGRTDNLQGIGGSNPRVEGISSFFLPSSPTTDNTNSGKPTKCDDNQTEECISISKAVSKKLHLRIHPLLQQFILLTQL